MPSAPAYSLQTQQPASYLPAQQTLSYMPVPAQTSAHFQLHTPVTERDYSSPPTTSLDHPFDRIAIMISSGEHIDDDDDRRALDKPLPHELAPAKTFAARVVGQTIEVLQGHRPIRHLQSWLTPGVYRALASRAGLNLRLHGPASRSARPVIRRLCINYPRRRIAEVSVVIHDGFRIRAVALRLEIRRERWQVTALEIA